MAGLSLIELLVVSPEIDFRATGISISMGEDE